jgi:MoaA/NifB/PqqE/SkfB family radical SAM enzyme
MITTTAIDLVKPEPMMVTWDIGRRCNYDCTYCESTRHDIHSPYTKFEDLKNTFDFIKQWTDIYNSKRKDVDSVSINFTGGEPTINPHFWELIDYIKKSNGKYNLGLTTNGSWGPKYSKRIQQEFNGVTISYHAEADDHFKKRVIDNILELSNTDMWFQVNVMLHVDHWQECVDLCNLLKEKGIKHNPRPIGDGNIERKGWFIDADGTNRRTSHTYSTEQKEWFWEYNGIKNKATDESEGSSLGRSCCGGRCLQGKVENKWQEIKLVNTDFKDWHCMVDWYFLHIDQHTGNIYHHQTCQALHNGQRGPVGKIADAELLLNDLKTRLLNPQPIICPNQRCGCGMCVPKAKTQEDYKILFAKSVSY